MTIHEAGTPQRDRTWVGFVLGIWLAGVFAASLYGKLEGKGFQVMGMALLALSLAWPPIYFSVSRCRLVPSGFSPVTYLGLALFSLFCVLSSFISPAPLESTGYTVLTVVTALVALQFNSNLNAAQYEVGLRIYVVLMTALVLGFAAYDYVPGIRLGGGKRVLNPASFALITMSVFVTAMIIRRAVVRIPILVATGTVIYLTGSRASAVAGLFGLAVTLVCRRSIAGARGWVLMLACCVIGAGAAAYYADDVMRGLNEFFALQDRHRGIESGGSGRLETWKATWNLFLSHPIMGVGFRAHETLLKINTSAHNGYLALLAEIGMIGFAAVLFLTLNGLKNTWSRTKDSAQTYSYSVLFGLASGYFVLAVFERYYINVGNPTSLLFLLVVLSPPFASAPSSVPLQPDETESSDAAQQPKTRRWALLDPGPTLTGGRVRT